MHFGVITLFPEMFDTFCATAMVGRALSAGALQVTMVPLRPFGLGRHKTVDDTPYGGGSGMVMRVDCLVNALESFDAQCDGERAHRVLLSPQGQVFNQAKAHELVNRPRVALLCGRYEGFDERVLEFIDEEVSIGDYVMTGGEVAAMAIIETCARLLPGVLGNPGSTVNESHSPDMGGMLEYPQYTRPAEFRGRSVPEILISGHHAKIEAWRREQAHKRTAERRPDLWAKLRAPEKQGQGS